MMDENYAKRLRVIFDDIYSALNAIIDMVYDGEDRDEIIEALEALKHAIDLDED